MNKEDLIAMGLTEEQAKKVMDSLDGNYVTKTRFNEVNEENKTLKKSVSDRDKQLEDLKKSSGDNEELKKQIETLQQENANQKKAHEAEMTQLRLDNAIDAALTAGGAKNIKAVRALLDTSKVKAFLCPAGTGIEGYATTLHYAPCSAKKGQGFRVIVVLPKGTNTDKPEIQVLNTEDAWITARNKWLLAHPDADEAKQGAYVGITGENIDIADCI